MTKNEPVFTTDMPNKQITVVRAFDVAPDLVWQAWTRSDILDQWWAPKPYKAETKTMDFRVGGHWLYCMCGPAGDRTWCRVDYLAIVPQVSISSRSSFRDEEGRLDTAMPAMNWLEEFRPAANGTTVTVVLTFASETDLGTIVKMGFKEGFTMGMGNLDEYLSANSR